jgi:hypothetical protein
MRIDEMRRLSKVDEEPVGCSSSERFLDRLESVMLMPRCCAWLNCAIATKHGFENGVDSYDEDMLGAMNANRVTKLSPLSASRSREILSLPPRTPPLPSPIMMRKLLPIFLLFLAVTSVGLPAVDATLSPSSAMAAEPGWSPVIIATGEYRRQIEETPIEQRPYRPLHIYGNTVRRMHYRGTPLPLPREAVSPRVLVGFRPFRR